MKNEVIFLLAALIAVFTAFSPSPVQAGILTESSGRSPACISCHSVSAMGLEGGYLASDISGFAEDFGAEGAADFLKNIPIEVMARPMPQDPSLTGILRSCSGISEAESCSVLIILPRAQFWL